MKCKTKFLLACAFLALYCLVCPVVYANKVAFVLVKIKKQYPVAMFQFNGDTANVSPLIKNAIGQFHISHILKASSIRWDEEIARWIRIDFSLGADLAYFKKCFMQLPFVEEIDEIPDRSLNEEWCSGRFTQNWFPDRVHCPSNLLCNIKHPIKIAIVDDAFRLSHKAFRDFIWKNPGEIPGNHFDDDGNGYADDFSGWDVSDEDNDVSPPDARLNEFYHGTYIAGIIATVLIRAYGKNAPEYFKIIPVKCVSDYAEKMIIKDGYKGIEYAIKVGADIINCSWAGDNISTYEKELLRIAKEKNILIVASAGNLYAERNEFPAAYENVIGVAAIDSMNRKLPFSNYGEYVSLSAPGIDICSAGVMSDSQYMTCKGTSASTAIVTAACAILLSQKPHMTPVDVNQALKNSALIIDSINMRYCGKLGAGLLNIEESLQSLNQPSHILGYETKRSQGALNYSAVSSTEQNEWRIEPIGKYKGIKFSLIKTEGKPGNSKLSFLELSRGGWKEYSAYTFSSLPNSLLIPRHPVMVKFEKANSSRNFSWNLGFAVITIDSTILYCSGTRHFELSEGEFGDGSQDENYANNCDCKWLITVEPGKRVQIDFTDFDSQPKVDFVYLYDGEYAIPENIIAKFSGHAIPPVVSSRTNKVLVWFVTDGSITGKGWQLHYKAK